MNKSGKTSPILKIAIPLSFLILLGVLVKTIQNGLIWESFGLVLVEVFLLVFNYQIFIKK